MCHLVTSKGAMMTMRKFQSEGNCLNTPINKRPEVEKRYAVYFHLSNADELLLMC